MFDTPILFIIFNRPETTFKVFEQIKKIKPNKLFVAADGPRQDKEADSEKCLSTRQIVDQIDWPCELALLFKDTNAGPFWGPVSAISWFFSKVERGIILEDDCLPDLSFFYFCEHLLDFFKDNTQVMHISGSNTQFGRIRGEASYYFSKYAHVWGWASWRRAWQYYEDIPKIRSYSKMELYSILVGISWNNKESTFWKRKFGAIHDGKRNGIWDYQWNFTIWKKNGLIVVPNVNLVTNIGFNREASGTKDVNNKFANIPYGTIDSINHMSRIEHNKLADYYTFFESDFYFYPSLKDKIRWKIKELVPKRILAGLNSLIK